MKFQKLALAITCTLFLLTGMIKANDNNPSTDKCGPVVQLNQTMKAKLALTNSQSAAVLTLNKHYWFSRKNIMNTPEMVGQNTALLACWDKWRLTLAEHLTKVQMEKFFQWQSKIDLLGKTPF